ncbi:hypothetical protein F7725_020909 [Dissostichus mawsoni]|uniref:Uncharacterized protein n=1 Tax=Dissostichus mawsoni TaxID=36200 RepID=A0A7J5YFT9_DISMA|nr:hypothetical protein F7725_020909 [Dissostichus mawsoni]
MGWSLQGGRGVSFSSVALSMGQPQDLKNADRFIPTVWEKFMNFSPQAFSPGSIWSEKLSS